MKKFGRWKMTRKTFLIALLAAGAMHASAAAQVAPVRLFASNGVRPVIQALTHAAEGVIAHPLAAQFNTTTVLKERIEKGEPFDAAILTADALDSLIKAGKIQPASRVEVGTAGIGVGIRSGTKKPDIRTAEAIKQTLMNAKAITYAQDGASRPHIEKMVNELGIAESMKSKTLLKQGSDASMASVADGQAEIVLTLVSEILQAPGIELVGPLPARFQNYVRFAAGVGVGAKNPEAAAALIKFLTDPKVAPTFTAKGFEAVK
jgi:molybdate transport system substrate-binding protein